MPDLGAGNTDQHRQIQGAATLLLMKCYLNRGAFNNRAAPTFDDADMQKVITLGTAIITSGKYTLQANYFDNFSNADGNSKELIFGISCNRRGKYKQPGYECAVANGFPLQ